MAAPKLISRRYEVLEQLGQGGMGTVYKVRHTALGSISALKVLPPELMQEPEMVTRFYREARIMANLSHPNIVRVLDIDHDDALDFHYFVMEYVEGQTLKKYVEQKGSLSLSETLDVAGQVARALAYAHGHAPPIIHRDIKPSNIMIEDRSRRVVVMDFGIAKELDGKELTRPGVTVGTLKYCAPEQMRQEQLDGAVDVYALGMVMYEAFTGRHLYFGLGERELVARVLIEKSENRPVFERPAPPGFQALVTRAIAKAREARYPTMAAFLRDLETCQGDATPLPARGTGMTGRFRPRLVSSRGDGPRPTELKSEWRDEAATQPSPPGPTPELRRQVDEVRQRTGLLRDATSSVKGRHRDRAERGWRRAERLLEEGKLAEAKTSFEEAATLFSALQSRVGVDATSGDSSLAAPARQLRPEDATVVAPLESEPAPAAVEPPPPEAVASATAASADPARTATIGPAAPGPLVRPGRGWLLPAMVGAGALVSAAVALYLLSGEDEGPARVAREPVATARPQRDAAPAPAPAAEGTGVGQAADAGAGVATAPAVASEEVAASPGMSGGEVAPAAKLAVIPPKPSAAPEPVADAAGSDAAPGEAQAALPPDVLPPADARQIIRFTRNPTVDIDVPLPPNASATLDDVPLKADRQGKVRASLTALPVGPSRHTLRVTDSAGVAEDIPVLVTYYPGWEIRRFAGLNGEAYAVAYSPDGKHVAAGTRNNAIKTWNAATGELELTFAGHRDWVNDVAFSPDGKTLVSGSKDRTLKIWDVATGAELKSLEGHKGWVNGVAFSPDGSEVASVSDDKTVRIWNVDSAEELASLVGHEDWILAVAFSPDGKRVASGGRDKVVKVWDLETGELVRTLSGHGDWVNAVAFSPDGRTVASASDDRRIRIWDIDSGKTVRTLSGHGGWVVALAFSPDGTRLASASKDQTVRLWDVETGRELRTFSGHRGLVGDVAFSPDGDSVVSGGRDRTLRLWWTASEPAGSTIGFEKSRDSG
jgi:WD40 repeat protein/serine/threonine protein kinase